MLSDKKIKESIADGRISISPFDIDNLSPNGYDVTLYNEYWRRDSVGKQIFLGEDPDVLFPRNYYVYQNANNYKAKGGIPHVILPPGSLTLCSTIEFIGTPHTNRSNDLVAFFRTRSTLARWGLTFDLTGMGDAGYCSRWTLEVVNHTKDTMYIPVGFRIGQLVFFEIGEVDKPYKGGYNKADGDWSPNDMLPKVKRRIP
jgi:dCTP deaminase